MTKGVRSNRRFVAAAMKHVAMFVITSVVVSSTGSPAFAADKPNAKTCIDTDPNVASSVPGDAHLVTAFVTRGTFDAAGDDADTPGQVHNDCGGNAFRRERHVRHHR